jgi:hypothetical protein
VRDRLNDSFFGVKAPLLLAGAARPCVTDRPVSRILSRTAIPLGGALLRRSSDLPGTFIPCGMPLRGCRAGPARDRIAASSFPIWSCSVWGLPCLRRYRRSGAPLPHLFTLTLIPFGMRAVCFLWHSPSLSLNAQVPDVIRHTALRSPDFPLPLCLRSATAAVQSACRLILPRMRWKAGAIPAMNRFGYGAGAGGGCVTAGGGATGCGRAAGGTGSRTTWHSDSEYPWRMNMWPQKRWVSR